MERSIVEVAGTPREMGESFGEACREQIRELYAIRMTWAIRFAREHGRGFDQERVLDVCERCLGPTRDYDPEGYEEFRGIGLGAGLSPAQVFALHGLTDLRDLLAFGAATVAEGCSSFILGRDRAQGGKMLLGQNWDLQTDNLPYVCLVHRRPSRGPETWSLTVTGGLTLLGINSEGIAVGNTNITTRDARIGVQYLSVLHRALASTTLDEAVRCVVDAPRAGAHYYYLGGPDGVAWGLECSATRCARFEVTHGVFVHCNHARSPEIAALETEPPAESTRFRQRRLSDLMAGRDGPIGIADIKEMLSDHEGDGEGLCRHDHDCFNTNACVILSPETREIHACRGQAHVGEWVTRAI